MKKTLSLLALMMLTFCISAQETAGIPSFFLKINPCVDIPIGSPGARYRPGGSGILSTGMELPVRPAPGLPFFILGDLGYTLLPFDVENTKRLNLVSAGTGFAMDAQIVGRLFGNAYIKGGYYYGFTEDDSGQYIGGGNPYVWAGAELNYYLNGALSLSLGTLYKNYLGTPEPLAVTTGVYFGTNYRYYPAGTTGSFSIQPVRPGLLQISDISFEDVFPVFYQYYDDRPIGTAIVKNTEKGSISDLKVSLFIKQYMDSPKTFEYPKILGKKETAEIPLYALFNDRVLEITEGTKVAAEISLKYMVRGSPRTLSEQATLSLNHRNASIWDDDRRAAAFVTANDPSVMRLGKSTAGLVRHHGYPALDLNLRTAIALHQSLAEYGMSYVVDRSTPYEEFVKKKFAIDFLQFPRQTMEYKAGDCDDLSILYAALLESVGVETAFITVPGHIYIAFALQMSPDEAKRFFLDPESFLVINDKAWVPLEVTEISGGFLKAWDLGTREWKKYTSSGSSKLYPLHDAWHTFAPVGLPGEGPVLEFPSERTAAAAYERELNRLVERELFPRVEELRREIARNRGDPRAANRLGVLYARYGKTSEARREFQKILDDQEYLPALINLGNVHLLEKNFTRARDYYRRAYQKAPENPVVLVGLARLAHSLEDYVEADENYKRLKSVDPEMAGRFEYLALESTGSARASESDTAGELMIWEEE